MELDKLTEYIIEFYDKLSSWEHSVVRESNLSPAQVHTIEVIGHNRDLNMKELASRLGITTGTLTVAVDRLEKLGLVAREPHQNDRRSFLVVLTSQGKEVYEKHHQFHYEFTRQILEDLDQQEIDSLVTILPRILSRM